MISRNFLLVMALLISTSQAEAAFKIRQGVRPVGLGGAFVSMADDGTAVWWNPAGLGEREVSEFNISGGQIFPGLSSPTLYAIYANSVQPLGHHLGVGAWHFSLEHTGFDSGNDEPASGYYQEGMLGLSYGQKFAYRMPFNLGFSLNFPFKNLKANDYIKNDPLFEGRHTLMRYAIDLGLLIRLSDQLSLGASVRNLNEPNMSYEAARRQTDALPTDRIPYTYQAGFAFRRDFKAWTLKTALEYSRRNRLINNKEDKMLHFGAEGWFFRGMSGFRFGFNRDEIAFGFSGRVNQQSMPIQLDLSYAVPLTELKETGNMLRAALRFQFGREGGFSPEVTIGDFKMSNLFAAQYKYYATTPAGYVEIANDTGNTFKNIKVGLLISQFMDFPTETKINRLTPYSRQIIPIYASFNNKILNTDEDTPMQARLTVTYNLATDQKEQSLAATFTLHSRNALNWTDPAKIGTFITPKNSAIDNFIKQVIYPYIPENANSPYTNLSEAMQIFDIFSAYGIRYIVDPNNPYNGPQVGADAIDYIRYPTETLRLRSGDCDDVAALFCTALENLGISTGLVDVPGHVFSIFNLGMSLEAALLIGLPADLLLRWEDIDFYTRSTQDSMATVLLAEERNLHNQVWIPVETTLLGAGSFIEAWQAGLENYRKAKNKRRVILIQDAWRVYAPATLDPTEWEPKLPDAEKIGDLLRADKKRLLQEISGSRIEQLRQQVNSGERPADAFNSLGVIYCQGGLYEEGERYFRDALNHEAKHAGAHNNLGNIAYQNNRWDEAIEHYKISLDSDPNDASVYVNIALAHYKKGDYIEAKDYLKKAIEIYPGYSKLYQSLWGDE